MKKSANGVRGSNGNGRSAPVSYIQAASTVESTLHGRAPEDCHIHDSLLDPDADLALTSRGFYSSKLCLITTESEDSDADSEDIDTTEYPAKALRRPDGYSSTLQESII